METRTGTNHFKNLDAAIKYYAPQGEGQKDVLEKWRNLEICIGQPFIDSNQDFFLDEDGRYWIIN